MIKEQILKDNPAVREGFNVLDQEVYDALPTLDSVDKHGRQMEPEQSPKVRIAQRKQIPHRRPESKEAGSERQEPGELIQDSCRKCERGNFGTLEPTPELIAEIGRETNNARLVPLGSPAEDQPEPKTLLKEHVVARYTLADFKKAQDMDIVIGTLKRLLKNPKGNLNNVPKTIREGIQAYFRQAKDRLFVNGQGILCLRRRPAERNCFFNHSMIIMPQLYQAEVLYRTHDEMGHQGVNKVVARIQQRHDWMGLQLAVNKWINACKVCQ